MARKRFRQVIEGWFEDQFPEEDEPATDEETKDWLQGQAIISVTETGEIIQYSHDLIVAEVTLSKFEILPLDPFHGVEEQRGMGPASDTSEAKQKAVEAASMAEQRRLEYLRGQRDPAGQDSWEPEVME